MACNEAGDLTITREDLGKGFADFGTGVKKRDVYGEGREEYS